MKFVAIASVAFSFALQANASTPAEADVACQELIKARTIAAWADVIDSPAGPISTVSKVTRLSLTGDKATYEATEFWNDDLIVGAAASAKVDMDEDGCRVTEFSIHQ